MRVVRKMPIMCPGLIVARALAFISFLRKAIQCNETEEKQDLLHMTSVFQYVF